MEICPIRKIPKTSPSPNRRLVITYLLEDTALFGGVKVVLHQANLLARRGHEVRVVGPGKPPDWYPLEASYLHTTGLDPHEIPPADVTVATFWTTLFHVDRARAAGSLKGPAGQAGEVLHFCQGFEAELTHNEAEHPRILQAYELPFPAMTVSPHLAKIVRERFARPAKVVPQPLGPAWRAGFRWRPCRPARVLVTGPWEIYLKGVPVALEAVIELRRRGLEIDIVRLSQWPLCREEEDLAEPKEFHHHVPPEQVPKIVRSCDLILAPSWSQEGFGLPVLEAMAAGVPAVVSDIPSFRGFAETSAELVPFDQPQAFAERAERLLSSPSRWRAARRKGLRVARGYSEPVAAEAIERALFWAANGAWRNEKGSSS